MTNQSVLLSIFYCWCVVGLWRKQVQERSPAFPGGSQGIPKSERIYMIPPSSGSAWSLFPSSLNPCLSLNKSYLSIKQFSSMNLLIFLSGCCIWAKIWKSFLICHTRRGRKVISIHPFASIHLWSDCRDNRYPSSQQHPPAPPEEFPVQRWYITPLAGFGSATRSPSSDTCKKKKSGEEEGILFRCPISKWRQQIYSELPSKIVLNYFALIQSIGLQEPFCILIPQYGCKYEPLSKWPLVIHKIDHAQLKYCMSILWLEQCDADSVLHFPLTHQLSFVTISLASWEV